MGEATIYFFRRLMNRNQPMKTDLNSVFAAASRYDRVAQKQLYEMFSGKMLAIAKSYVVSVEDAEDILVTSFLKAFEKINDCREAQSFPFWLRKLVVNDAISFIRKNKNILYADADVEGISDDFFSTTEEENFLNLDFDVEEILAEMPLGYKLVFNLYVFENKKHSEISLVLNINEGTSKSQLSKAKKWLLDYFKIKHHEKFS